ncbi:MAG: T9SS type A sorting domain-containing protein [Cyclobacteriaceae bacterium]|nr:T9SS type A sorting domain-containing protein [Cyclobacteriaceae bacterium]
MKSKLLVVAFQLIYAFSFGQAGNYRSLGSGTWGTPGTWERDADLNGSFEESPSTVAPTSTSGTITIRNGHVVTVAAILTTDQTTVQNGGTLTINAGVTVTLGPGAGDDISVNSGGVLNVNGTIQMVAGLPGNSNRLRVDGTLNNAGSIINSTAVKLTFRAGSSYFHLFDGTTANAIPVAGWDATSTMSITGLGAGGANVPTGLSQTFGNFVWNTPNWDQFVDLAGAPSNVTGNFQIDDTGVGGFYWNQMGGANTTLNIGGNFVVNGGVAGFIAQTATPGTMTITGDMILAGGYFQLAEDVDASINVVGDISISGGIFDFSFFSAVGVINAQGNVDFTGGDILVSAAPTGSGTLNFVGTSGTQIYTSSLVPSGSVNYYVSALSVVSIPATSFLAGSGTLTVDGTLQIASTSSSGAMQTGTLSGNVRVSGSRTYNSGCTIVYNGLAGQFIGNGHPTTSGVNTTVNNSSGVSLIVGVPVIITTNLTLTSGNLNILNGALTLNGTLSAGGNFITIGSGGSITISGSGSIGTFPFPSGAQTFTNLTLDNSNGVTFANNVTITGVLTLTSGSLSFPGQTLTLNGTFSGSGSGDLSPSSSSTLTIGGSGPFGTLRINSVNSTLGTLTFNRSSSGTASLNSQLIVNTTFNLTNGTFTNTSGLQMANGSTLVRNSNGTLSGNPPTDLPPGQHYSVTYTGSTLTTGLELPTVASDMLLNLTINGGTVTLDKSTKADGNVQLTSSTLDANGFNITMGGSSATWNKGAGNFTGGTGAVIIAGGASVTITASSTPTFSNVTANSGSTLTMPTGTVNITGNLQLNSGGTFNANTGTINLNGSGAQVVAGAGKTFANITVNKSGGSVTLSSAVNLTGLLNIQSATTVASGGNLTLISNGSGTASIGDLSGGGSVTGSVAVQRFITGVGRHYRDISAQVLNPTVSQIIASGITITGPFTGTSFPCTECATNGSSMYFYNEAAAGVLTNGYVAHPPNGGNSTTSTLSPGRGYNLLVRSVLGSPTMSLSGTINSGSIVLPVTFTASAGAADDGWNFVGNPYPSAVDWDIIAGWTKTNYGSNAISVWDPTKGTSGGYRTWNGSTGDLGSGRIAAGQGFWIHGVSGTAITIHEQAKTSTSTAFLRNAEKEADYLEIALKEVGSTDEDYAYIQLHDKAALTYDNFDAVKRKSPSFNLSFLSGDGVPLAINLIKEIPYGTPVFLSISDIGMGSFMLQSRLSGLFSSETVMLHDKFTGEVYDLNSSPYTFNVSESLASQPVDRFYIVFGEKAISAPSIDVVRVYPNPVMRDIAVIVTDQSASKEVIILDLMGNEVGAMMLHEESGMLTGSKDLGSLTGGVYMIKVFAGNRVYVRKFIKN